MRKPTPPPAQPIFILSGAPTPDKRNAAVSLMQHFSFGVHIPVQEIQGWVVSGLVRPTPAEPSEEGDRQLRLARWSALQTATIYAEAQFAVVLDDVVAEPVFQRQYQQLLHGYPVHKILLTTSADDLDEPDRQIQSALLEANKPAAHWLVIDTGKRSGEEIAQGILESL